MIRAPEEMRALTQDLTTSAWTLAAIGALFESGLVDHLREPRSLDELAAHCLALSRGRIERCMAVAVASGVVVAVQGERYRLAEGAMPFVQQPMRGSLQGDIRSNLMQPLAFLDDAASREPKPAGWHHTNVALLQAQGDASSIVAMMFKAKMLAALGDLAERLDRPGARFLDVGVGVASLAIAMCRAFPKLHVVGLDPSDAPLAIARGNIARANLAEQIELRQLGVEDLRDDESFDFAWLPTFFIPATLVAPGAARVRASLRPGGWILFPVSPTGDDLQGAVSALLNETWGGPKFSAADAESILKEAGFTSVRALPGPPRGPGMVVGQR